MNGGVKFEDALAARLDLIKPSKNAIQSCLLDHPPILTKGTIASIGVRDLLNRMIAQGSNSSYLLYMHVTLKCFLSLVGSV